jgi:hypothetical protein
MCKNLITLCLLVITIASCKKDNADPIPGDTDKPTTTPFEDIRLKDIIIPRLPSPYYHFEYDQNGKMNIASFASDLIRYHVNYSDHKVSEMRNTFFNSKSGLRFLYDSTGKITTVNYLDDDGSIGKKVTLTYNGPLLTGLQREAIVNNNFVVNKTMSLSYYADSNLSELKMHYPAFEGNEEIHLVYNFSNYDNKSNVDDFSLLHNDFFDQLIFLPGVRIQKNNPMIETLKGGNDYVVEYTYEYNDKDLPVSKSGDLLFTKGTDSGKHFQLHTAYTYY